MRKKIVFPILFLLICSSSGLFAQKRSLQIGGKIIQELTFSHEYSFGIGGQVIYRAGKHTGIETGIYYKNRPYSYQLYPPATNGVYRIEVMERNILLPLLFRFDSPVLNFSIGPVIEYFAGWKQNLKRSGIKIDDYHTNKIELISAAGISKNFSLSQSLIFEPELRFSAFVPNGDGGWALNLSLRKKIF